MRWREALVTHLTANAKLADLVADRIYPGRLGQFSDQAVPHEEDVQPGREIELPAIVYYRVSTDPLHTHDGLSSLRRPRVSFACWGRHDDEAEDVGDALIAALAGFKGLMGGLIDVGACLLASDAGPQPERESELAQRTIDFNFQLTEVA